MYQVVTVDPHSVISNQALVRCSLPVTVDAPPLTEIVVRGWRHVNRQRLASLLTTSPLCATPPASATDVDHLFDTYHTVLLEIANQLAPLHVVRRRPGCPTPWFDAECRAQRRECRRL